MTQPPSATDGYPENPALVHVWRGSAVESQHRGTWVVTDTDGEVIAGSGRFEHPFFVRSTIKSLQALPLIETGAAEAADLDSAELALAIASHDGEECHTSVVAGLLERLGLAESDLLCGPQVPGSVSARREMTLAGAAPNQLMNNCSGKHAGFLALAKHMGVDPAAYIDPASPSQELIRRTVCELAGVETSELTTGLDGCSAPTFRFPLVGLARAFARMANPDGLAPDRAAACRRLTAAATEHPVLIGGSAKRLDTDLAALPGGLLFPKVGADAVYAVGHIGSGRGLAVKMDDGSLRGMHPLVMHLLEEHGFLDGADTSPLEPWTDPVMRNRAGLGVGRVEVLP
jgi:L-asparaginase II